MTDMVELLRAANPVPEPMPFASDVRARIADTIVARDRRTRRRQRILTALTRSRVLALAAGAVLLAGGTAAAVVALTDQPSAPPSGRLHPLPGVAQPLHYSVVAVPDLNGGAVGWCLFDSEQVSAGGYERGGSCGDVQLPGHAIVAVDAGSGGSLVNPAAARRARVGTRLTYVSDEYLAYVTTAAVAAVRVTPSLTIRTRPDQQLPNGYRIAVWIRAHVLHGSVSRQPSGRRPRGAPLANLTLPDPSAAVALDSNGRAIGLPGAPFARLHDAAPFWQARPSSGQQPSLRSPPPGACEIDTTGLRHIQLFFGSVVQHVQGFPELAGRTFLSCAETQFAAGAGLGVDAAVLLDAQHPGTLPEPIAGATTVGPGMVNVPSSTLGEPKSLTARRVGNAWLAVEAGGTLNQRIRILNGLRVCVRLGPTPCPSP